MANRSLTYDGVDNSAVDIVPLPAKNTITDTNAILWAQVNKPSAAAVTTIGCRLRKDGDTYENGWSKYETPSRSYVGSSYMQPYYNANTELGVTLTHATKYYIRFYAVVGGQEYWSDEYSFQTTGSHSYGQWVTTTAETCTTAGVQKRSCACGLYETQSVPALGHHMGEWRTTAEASCSAAGTQIQECTRCTYYNTREIPKTAHSYSSAWITSGTQHWHECTACGVKRDHAAHVPGTAATETKPQTCTVCGYIITPNLVHRHSYSEGWRFDSSGHWHACSGCSERKDFSAHVYDNQCDPSCNICGYIRVVSHKYSSAWVYDSDGHWHACSVCNDKKNFTKHIYDNACDSSCNICGYVRVVSHKYSDMWNYDNDGHWHACTVCGYQGEPVAHIFGEWEDAESATCTEGGTQKRVCTKCAAEETRNTEPLGHDFETPTVVKEATISAEGRKEGKCKHCEQVIVETIPCSDRDEVTGILFETAEGVFAQGTQLTIGEIKQDTTAYQTAKSILSAVSDTFTLYDISAALNGAQVQPNGEVTVTFQIPEGYGRDVAVFFLSDEGSYKKLESFVSEDGKTVSVTLNHFSQYAVCRLGTSSADVTTSPVTDHTDQVTENTDRSEQSDNTLWIVIAVAALLIAVGAVTAVVITVKKKQNTPNI